MGTPWCNLITPVIPPLLRAQTCADVCWICGRVKIFLSVGWECPPPTHTHYKEHVCPRRCATIVPQAANVRYKSAYFQIPSAWLRTKAAPYVAGAIPEDRPPGCPRRRQGDVLMADEDASKGWQEVTDPSHGWRLLGGFHANTIIRLVIVGGHWLYMMLYMTL